MAKTHYGYKDGQFKQGECRVTTGTCPYGNHSEDPNKINDLREYVSKTLDENPSYEAVYNLMSRMHGEKNVTAAMLTQQGIPAKLAKAWANEPVSEEYERDYVAGGAEIEQEPVVEVEPVIESPVAPPAEDPEDEFLRLSEEDVTEDEDEDGVESEVAPEPAKPAPPAVTETIPTDDELEDMYPDVPRDMRMRLWKNAMRQAGVPIPKPEDNGEPSEDELEELYPTVPPNARLGRWKRDKRELEDVHRWNKNNTAFTNIAEKLSTPSMAGTLTDEEKALLEEPYKDMITLTALSLITMRARRLRVTLTMRQALSVP